MATVQIIKHSGEPIYIGETPEITIEDAIRFKPENEEGPKFSGPFSAKIRWSAFFPQSINRRAWKWLKRRRAKSAISNLLRIKHRTP